MARIALVREFRRLRTIRHSIDIWQAASLGSAQGFHEQGL